MTVIRTVFHVSNSRSITVSVSRFLNRVTIVKSFKTSSAYKSHTKLRTPSSTFLFIDHLRNQRLDEARVVSDQIISPDVGLYTMMIASYAKNDRLDDALNLFEKMPTRDTIAWNSMIKGCLDCGDLSMAKRVFDAMPERNVITWTTMVNGYLKFESLQMAEKLFREMPARDAAAWNSMIHGYLKFGRVDDALRMFAEMPFRNVISWTSMINGLDQNGNSEGALCLFSKMLSSRVEPTSSTFSSVLTACANVSDLHLGLQIHSCIVKKGFWLDEFICASLITFYANCRKIIDSQKVFNETLSKNMVIWTALVSGYSFNCKHEHALMVFADMIKNRLLPNQLTFTSVLNSCCELESLDRGKEVHAVAMKLGLAADSYVGNSLIVMYTNCGNLIDAVTVFRRIGKRNIVSWNSIIVGCAQHGYGMWALTFFNQMVRRYTDPDEITFTGLLTACSRSGLLEKGKHIFKYMSRCIPVRLQHYACMVDILGRCGKLKEAEELIESMSMRPNSMVWLALLSACRTRSDLDRAKRAANCIFELEPNCSAAYVLLSNLYASAGKWNDVSRMRLMMKQRGVVKQSGRSWVVLRGQRHEFRSGDTSHPVSDIIYQKLDWLSGKLKELGYVPDQRCALHDVEDEQKEEMLSYHSERLAIGFGLMSTIEGSTITVMKNLRVCGDCHSVIKLIAKIVSREIVVRDSSRFHHFKGGVCSCGDHW